MTREEVKNSIVNLNAKIGKVTHGFKDFSRLAAKYDVDTDIVEVGYLERVDDNLYNIINNNMEEVEPGFVAFTDNHLAMCIMDEDDEMLSYVVPYSNVTSVKMHANVESDFVSVCIAIEFDGDGVYLL